jgi:hypothetical protein
MVSEARWRDKRYIYISEIDFGMEAYLRCCSQALPLVKRAQPESNAEVRT